MTILRNVGDAIQGDIVICEYKQPSKLRPKRFPESSGHRSWRIKLHNAFCVIEKKVRWIGE